MEHSLTDLDRLETELMVEPEPEEITLPGELHSSVYGAPRPASSSCGSAMSADSSASFHFDKSLAKKLHPTVVRGMAVLAARTRSTRAAQNTADQLRDMDIDQLKNRALAEGVDAHAVGQSESREQIIHMVVEKRHRLYARNELRELNRTFSEPSKTGTNQDHQACQTKTGKYWWDQLRQKLSTVGELSLFLHDDVKKLYVNDGSDREEVSQGFSDQADINYEDTALSKAERALKVAERKSFFLVPYDKRRQAWDLGLCILLIYVGIMIPVRIGFEITLEPGDLGFAVDAIVDFLFACDIVLNLRTGIYNDMGFMVSDPIEVAKQYFKGWGCIDVVSSLPITYVLLIVGKTDNANTSLKGVRMLRLIRLTKLLRLLRLKSIFDRYAEELEPFLRSLSIVRILMMNIFIAHVCACMWHWVALPYGSESWLKDNLELDDDLSTKYTTSFYWSMTTLSTVGYGDISATNSAEQRLTVATELMGTTAFAYMAGTLSSIVMAAGLNEQEYNQKMGAIREYLRVKKVNKGMRRRIGKYFEDLYERKTAFDEGQVLGMMPPMMSRQLINEVYREFTSTMLLFRGLSEACITKLCLELRPYKAFGPVREVRKVVKGVDNGWIWAADKTPLDTAILEKIDPALTTGKNTFVWPKEIEPGEVLSHEHEEATELFIIHSGKCSVYSGGVRIGDLHAGAFFGETAMVGLGGGPDGTSHTRTVRACQDMSLSFLTRESLVAVTENHPELQEKLHKFAKYRYEKDQKKVRAENLAKILPNAKEARRAFKKAIKQHDHNGDGTLAADEMDKVLHSFGIKLTENDLHAFMHEIDAMDADGQISEEEFVRCFERLKETGENGPSDGIYRLIARMASYAVHTGSHQQGIPHHTYKGKFMPGSQLRTAHFPHPGLSKRAGLLNTVSKEQSHASGSSSEMQLEKLTAAIAMLTSKVEAIERRLS